MLDSCAAIIETCDAIIEELVAIIRKSIIATIIATRASIIAYVSRSASRPVHGMSLVRAEMNCNNCGPLVIASFYRKAGVLLRGTANIAFAIIAGILFSDRRCNSD